MITQAIKFEAALDYVLMLNTPHWKNDVGPQILWGNIWPTGLSPILVKVQ